MLPCIKTVVKSKAYEIGDKGLFSLLYKHGNENSIGFIAEDVVKGGYKLGEHIFLIIYCIIFFKKIVNIFLLNNEEDEKITEIK